MIIQVGLGFSYVDDLGNLRNDVNHTRVMGARPNRRGDLLIKITAEVSKVV